MDQTQPIVICDLSIWYRLADDRITPEQIRGLRLVGTYINGFEFCCSPNAYKNYDQLRSAVIAFRRYYKGLCVEIPFEYIRRVSGHDFNDQHWSHVDHMLFSIAHTEYLPDLNLARRVFTEYQVNAQQDAQPFLDWFANYRNKIKSRKEHTLFMNDDESRLEHMAHTKQFLAQLLGDVSIDWNKIELFVKTFDEWLRQMAIQPSLKMKVNDWRDLSNLVYVQPGSLYWTEDHRENDGVHKGLRVRPLSI